MALENLITDHLALWTAAVRPKSSAGRGSNSKLELTGIKKLRELILELAVRGKLVPQDPSDEPASMLLDRIACEKARLVKEKKIKKPKALPEIGEEEKPFELPEGWEWSRLQDLTSYIQRGKGPDYADVGTVKVISQKCIQWSGFDASQARFISDSSVNGYQNERFLQLNDLLWNSTGTGTVGRVNILDNLPDEKIVADSHVTVIRALEIDCNFLWCYIAAPGVQNRIEPGHEKSLVSGSTKQVELSASAVSTLVIPIPPLSEQHHIVAKVNELMALCDKLEQRSDSQLAAHQTLVETLLATLTDCADADELAQSWARLSTHFDTLFTTEASIDALKQTILQLAVMGKLVSQDPSDEPASALLERIAAEKAQLVKEKKIKKEKPLPAISEDEKPFDIPKEWVWVKLSDVSALKGGFAYKSNDFIKSGQNQVIRMGNVRPDSLRLDENPVFIEPELSQKTTDYEIVDGDILLTMTGTKGKRDYLYSVLVDTQKRAGKKLYLNQRLCAVRGLGIVSDFLNISLKSELLLSAIYEKSTGTANQANIGMEALSNWVLPLPPIREQHRVVAKVDQLMALCDQLKSRLQTSQQTQLALAESLVEGALA
ncbi:restriction endonuclease subunit S [Aeromonas veronii]|uniref:restriction endonuclease subunit S n=1 Tax=Aeromonas veronii TaxID=654 RepID=UPI00191CB12C|nr:restriction endonuclease subunit S [Aeromonas veronii]MBL0644130.1 restriction endonuclease subunit S [Aeromonas veronii]